MEIVKYVIFCVLITIAFLKNTESASDNNTCGCKASPEPGKSKLRTYGRQNRMYYEPRMGRLKRDVDSDEAILGDDRYESSFVNLIQDKPWTVITLSGKGQGGKRQSMTFTPRLGRKSNDDSSFTDPDPIEPPYFPRLGRTRVLAPPRLGRQLYYDANKQ